MVSLGKTVRALLESAGVVTWYFYPQSWLRLPAISWRESGNRELAQADGREHLSELEYTVDVWSKSPEEVQTLARTVDEKLASIRLRRDFAQDLFDPATGIYHRSARYRCVADGKGNVYQ